MRSRCGSRITAWQARAKLIGAALQRRARWSWFRSSDLEPLYSRTVEERRARALLQARGEIHVAGGWATSGRAVRPDTHWRNHAGAPNDCCGRMCDLRRAMLGPIDLLIERSGVNPVPDRRLDSGPYRVELVASGSDGTSCKNRPVVAASLHAHDARYSDGLRRRFLSASKQPRSSERSSHHL